MNNYKSRQERLYFQKTDGLIYTLKNNYRKIYKMQKAITFIEKCLTHTVQPKFAQIQVGLMQVLRKDEIFTIQQRNIKKELKKHKDTLPLIQNEFNTYILDFKKTFSNNFDFEKSISSIKNEIHFTERDNDQKRDRKLRLLINEKSKSYSKVEVFNLSSKIIPENIIEFLSLGRNHAVGGLSQGSNNYCEVEKLFSNFQDHARKNGINEENIIKIKCDSTYTAMDLEKSQTYDERCGLLKTFLRQNEDICLLNVDKSVSVCFIDRKDYHEKLEEIFSKDPNFELIKNFDHEANFKEYNKLLTETLGNSLNKNTLRSLEAQHSISSAYGLIKLHKPSKKLRPIVTGYNSMVANAHEYIKN